MDDDIITSSFFDWIEANEDTYDFPINYTDAKNLALTFTLDNNLIKFDFQEVSATSSSSLAAIKSWIEWVNSYLNDRAAEILTGEINLGQVLDKVISKYSEFKDFDSEQEGFSDEEEEEEDMDIDYRQEIIRANEVEEIKNAQRYGKADHTMEGIAEYAEKHFIFQEAQRAVDLLESTFQRCPQLRHSCKIYNYPSLCNVRIELDLAFLDISDSVMNMLGLNYDNPLTISMTVSEIKLVQSLEETQWTTSLMGSINFEILQGGSMDSYGCREYILGRVRKFRDDTYNCIRAHDYLPSVLALSRENSVEPESQGIEHASLIEIIEMGFSEQQSVAALRIARGNKEVAVDMLTGGFNIGSGIDFQDVIIPCDNFFYNLLFYIRDRLQKCTNYCFICYKKHEFESMRLRPCAQEICEFRFEEISGLSVYAEFRSNMDLAMLDLSLAAEALSSPRALTIFEPFPSFMLKSNQIRGKSGFLTKGAGTYSADMDSNKDIGTLQQIYRALPNPSSLLGLCNDENSLREALTTMLGENGMLGYKIMRYIVATNRLMLINLPEKHRLKQLPKIQQFFVTNHSPEAERAFQAKKKQHGSFFAFHGSAIENWYSILRNGIRNLSNTHMMTCGAAYGAGVYCAENIATSLGYTRMSPGNCIWQYGSLHNPSKGCMAILEAINKPGNKNSGSGIYVVQDDSDVIIRYLLIFTSSDIGGLSVNVTDLQLEKHYKGIEESLKLKAQEVKQRRIKSAVERSLRKEQEEQKAKKHYEEYKIIKKESEEQDKHLEEKLSSLEKAYSGQGSTTSNKRILQEYKYLQKSKECKGLTVEFEGGSNIYTWLVHLDMNKFEIPQELNQDFEAYAKRYSREKEMLFEVRFDSNFPFNPPFVRVIRPRFAFRTGHITVGGSICMQSLTASGWIPVRTVESIFIEILFNMAEGGAKLDATQAQIDYTLAEAQDAFNRVARDHKWI